ncbi:MAG TPA: hypothetical protein VI796_04815 [Candidatus Thermoplasmatota archaeon]|nr:hypothetical protein [Candidatus Thermoplasmatota archaeon]
MDVREVHELVANGQVVKAPNYHAGKRGIGFVQILSALENCYHVAPDDRPQHPNGWYALANLPNKRRLRIDFNVLVDDAGNLLLVVTAYDA